MAGVSFQDNLAGPATGTVKSLWYAAAGSRLLAQTESNRVFETGDFEHWQLNAGDAAPALPAFVPLANPPEPGARGQAAGTRLYAAGEDNVYASDDGGKSWLNLTGFNDTSILGGGFTSLAISPVNPQEISAANRFGVWRSLDGGLSWRGLNDDLPNLPVRTLPGKRTAALADGTMLQAESGAWVPTGASDPGAQLRGSLGARAGVDLTAAAQAGSLAYGGTADGRILASRDNGVTWTEAPRSGLPRIERIWVDPGQPESALAAAGTHLMRTVNGGLFWDDVTGALPPAVIHGMAADSSASMVYAATDRGVFQGQLSLVDAGPAASKWTAISGGLPAAPAWDVRLNSDNTLTVALDGYGVFETPAPHQTRTIRLANAADLSDRPAAPGSLISVLGLNVQRGSDGTSQFPVIASSDRISQLQVPFEAAAGSFPLALSGVRLGSNGQWTVPLTVKNASPAIFVDDDGAPLLLDSGGVVMDSQTAVHAGSVVAIMATGLGKVTPDWPTGVPAPLDAPPAVVGEVTAYLDGTPVQVTRATLAPGYVGYYLVELQIPAIVNKGASELRLVMNGEQSNRVKLYLDATLAQ